MGWETFAIAGYQALEARNTMKEGRAAARAIIAEAQIEAENKAHDTVRAAGKLQNSFLNSGLTLEDGPQDVIARAYAAGQKDINRIVENANIRSKNTMKASRTKMLEGIANTVKGIDFGVDSGVFGDIAGGLDTAWNGFGFGTGYDLSQSIRTNTEIF